MSMRREVLLTALLLTTVLNRDAVGASFQGLGDLPGGSFSSEALGISANGMTIVGRSTSASGTEAFRWTLGGGMMGLGSISGPVFSSEAWGVSNDGNAIVGTAAGAGAFWQPFRWTSSGGMVSLEVNGSGYGISADGNTVVGRSSYGFRWTVAGGMETPIGSQGFGVSADGSVVVGDAGSYAFRWTESGGQQSITPGTAWRVSSDGNTVVGRADLFSHYEAFRWTVEGLSTLGVLSGGINFSEAYDTSADGRVVVGMSGAAGGNEAFIWNEGSGMNSLKTVLAAAGVDLTGWSLTEAWGISDDGKIITGSGVNPNGKTEAWVAVIPEPGAASLTLLGACCLIARLSHRQRSRSQRQAQ